ncbi:MAG TPA: DNA polymerase I [Rhabdochlamydiaceae bacterium]|nr:DNA polymerase I [Rhabdochlamydiaceae bacterium]
MKSIYVVDAVNFLFRSYYAIGPMTNLKGASTGALFGFIRSIFKIIKDFSPTHLVAVFDGPQSSQHRKDIYSDYKIHRKAMPDDLYAQLEKAIEFCHLAGIPCLSIPKVEADDVMGSITKWGEKKGTDIYLCTSDKDLCQLVSDHVFVINPHKGNLLIDKEKVKELYGVFPEQMVDLLALMGDSSDNIPGIEGIGPKTAAQLLHEHGSLDRILENAHNFKEKKRELILAGKESALISRRLATIHTGVEFPQEDAFFLLKAPEVEKLKQFYHEMHFLTLLKEFGSSSESNAEEDPVSYTLINEEQALKSLIEKLKQAKEICIDTETTDLSPLRAELVGIGLGIKPQEAWYIPMNGALSMERCLQLLKPLLEAPGIRFFGHHLKYDLHVLAQHGIQIKHLCFDTLLASYLLAPHKPRHGLDELCLEKFGKVKIPITDLIGKGKQQISMKQVPLEKVATYCCEDVDYTIRLKELFEKELKEEKLWPVLEKIELPLIPVLMDMERHGMFLDASKIREMSHELANQIAHLQSEIYKMADETFNLNSPKQLSHILFEKLQIRPLKKTETGYSTSAEVLEMLEDASPIIPKIINYRFFEKLRSTYVDALPEQIDPKTGRIHCTFNQSGTATGRLACQDPNLQNIPVRSSEGRKLRTAFRPQLSHWSYLAADYSQIELRLLAHFSEDPVLTKAFQEGEDVHTYTASLVFDVPLKEVTSEMRHQAKAVNFGILYGQQAFGLAKELNIETKQAAALIETYFKRYSKVKEYLESCKETVRKTGKSFTMSGRQRPIPDINSKNPMIRSAAERLAVNTPLQGGQADLIKLAMIKIDQMLKKQQEQGYMILQVHDELIFEVPDDRVEFLAQEVKKIMETIFVLKVPLVVDISIGKNWGEC